MVMRILLLTCLLLPLVAATADGGLLTTSQIREPQPLLPYSSWLPDPGGSQTIHTVSSGAARDFFTPAPDVILLKASGPVWFRVELVKTAHAPSMDGAGKQRLVMNLGALPPGKNQIFLPDTSGSVKAQEVWRNEFVVSHENILLPEPDLLPVRVYIRMDSMPGPWFSPVIGPQNMLAPDLLPPELFLSGLLIAAILACLLRAAMVKTQWLLWAALYLFTLLLQVILPLPMTDARLAFADLPALLAPGMAVILLPHVARALFRPHTLSVLQNRVLYLQSLLGVAVCLIPVIPEFGWLTRLYPLWPLLLLPLLPLSLGALAAKRPGGLAFFGACALPALGAGITLYGLYEPALHALAVQGGLWGAALGGLGFFLARVPAPEEKAESVGKGALLLAGTFAEPSSLPADSASPALVLAGTERKQSGTDQSGPLLLAAPGSEAPDVFSSMLNMDIDVPRRPAVPSASVGEAPHLAEEALFSRADDVLSHGDSSETPESALMEASEPLPPIPPHQEEVPGQIVQVDEPTSDVERMPQHVQQSGSAQEKISLEKNFAVQPRPMPAPVDMTPAESDRPVSRSRRTRFISFTDDEPSSYAQDLADGLTINEDGGTSLFCPEVPPTDSLKAVGESTLFNPYFLVQNVYELVSPIAQAKGLFFSWHASPILPSALEGDAESLREVLSLMLKSTVQAARTGPVQLAVRAALDGTVLEHLLFSVSGDEPIRSTDEGFSQACGLAAQTGGAVTVEHFPQRGMRINLTVRFSLPSAEAAAAFAARLPLGRQTDGDMPQNSQPAANTPDAQNPSAAETCRDSSAPVVPSAAHGEFPATPRPAAASSGRPQANVAATPDFSATMMPENTTAELTPDNAGTDPQPSLPRIIIGEMTTSNRRLLVHYLTGIPHERLDALQQSQVLDLLHNSSASLIIFDTDMPESDIIGIISFLRRDEKTRNLPVLTLTSHESQAVRMLEAGGTFTLDKPFSRKSLLALLAKAIPSLAPYVANAEDINEILPAFHSLLPGSRALGGFSPASSSQPVPDAGRAFPPAEQKPHSEDPPAVREPRTIAPAFMQSGPAKSEDSPKAETLCPSPAPGNLPLTAPAGTDVEAGPKRIPSDAPVPAKPAAENPDEVRQREDVSDPSFAALPDRVATSEKDMGRTVTASSPREDASDAFKVPDSAIRAREGHKGLVHVLPGIEGEPLDNELLPLLPGLVHFLRNVLQDIRKALAAGDSLLIQESAARLARQAEHFSLHKLGKIVRCVERAAEGDDLKAVAALLEDLESIASRYATSLESCFESFLNLDRTTDATAHHG